MATIRVTKAQQREMDKAEAIKRLSDLGVKPGVKIYTILRNRSRSGMYREISLAIVDPEDGDVVQLDYWVAKLTGHKIGKHGGIVMGGCGMDMGFQLVYILGQAMWPNGTLEPHGKRNGQPDSTGGYALRHVWL